MSDEASLLDELEDTHTHVRADPFSHSTYTHIAGSQLPPRYMCAALHAAIRMMWRENPRTQPFLIGSVQRIARWLRDDGANPAVMLLAFKTIIAEQLEWVSTTRGTEVSETLRLKITGWAVEEFFRAEAEAQHLASIGD